MPDATNRQWMRAASFAAWKHRHQVRKDGRTPYIAHPFRVAMIVRDVFGCDDDEVLCAALLHDTIEDTQTDYDELHEHFGERVASLVSALTKNMSFPSAHREESYDRQLAAGPWEARLIKLADVYDNISDAPNARMVELARDKVRRALALVQGDVHLAAAAKLLEAHAATCIGQEGKV